MKPRLLQTVPPRPLTEADFETSMVHEFRATLAGRDGCSCRLCRRVDRALASETRRPS